MTAQQLFNQLGDRLGLEVLATPESGNEPAIYATDLSARPALAGFLNLIHPNKIQVLGNEEMTFLKRQSLTERREIIAQLLEHQPLILLVGDSLEVPELVVAETETSSTFLMRSRLPAYELVNYLQYYISRQLAHRTTLHGVFMEVFTIGVHIMGGAGCGKSELALELLTRGHRLIADDAPEFTQISPEIIDGTCPEALQDCLEVRGLGILNVRQMFGDAAIKLNKFLRLIIHLEMPGEGPPSASRDRLRGDTDLQQVLDLNIPRITLQVRAGRNLAVMVEAAVRDFMLKMKGYDAAAAFIDRHGKLLQKEAKNWQH